jgi:type IX secretion system PorP/SprF family membrane protein
MKKYIAISVLFWLAGNSFLKAQDYHVSQYDMAGMYLNPAVTGMYAGEKGDYRAYLDQRSQWRALGIKPFVTTYLGYDMPYQIKGKNLGFGGFIINNNGGIGNFNTFTFMGSVAYDVLNSKAGSISVDPTVSSTNKHYLTMGLQLGLFYRSTNPNALNYDIQYSLSNNGGDFDKSIPNNEAYNRVNITRFDANYGLFYKYIDVKSKVHPYAGFSMSHLSMPNESITGGVSRLPIKWIGYGGCDIKIDEKMDITPRVLYMNQRKASEVMMGFLFYYRINENNTKLVAGFDYRYKDAAIINIGLKHEHYTLRMSYDVNTSYLKNYSRGRGGFEISLLYSGQKGVPFLKSVSSF